jgi:nucleotide-binding universal stress UspA family protein
MELDRIGLQLQVKNGLSGGRIRMANLKKILVAYDGSSHSKAALGWAMLLGDYDNAELDVIKVFEPHDPPPAAFTAPRVEQYAEIEEEDRQMLKGVEADCKRRCKLKVHVDLLFGYVASTLLDYAIQTGVDLIVAGTRGHGVIEGMLVGSVTNSLVSLAKVPVLVVKEQQVPTSLKNILVAYDGSAAATAALHLAVDIGRNANAKLVALKVSDSLDDVDEANRKVLAEARSAAAAKGMEIGTELLAGVDIADTIFQYATECNADMIVAGAVGHGFLGEFMIGSVARKLISSSRIPVLTVKMG